MKQMVILGLFLIASISMPAQTLFYVDGTSGNDSNTGTSPGNAWKTIQKACNTANPNSIVLINAGIYKENLVMNVSGTAGNPIEFRNYQEAEVIIDGSGTSGNTLLSIIDKSYLIFNKLVFQNLFTPDARGILLECSASGNMKSLQFRNLLVRNIGWTQNASQLPSEIDNVQPFIAYGRGISSTNLLSDILIDSCRFYSNITGFSETVSLDGNISGFSITHNKVNDNTNIGIYAGGNYGECQVPSLDHARNGLIAYNNCYHNVSLYASSGGIYADGAMNVTIRNNECHHNGYGIEIGCEENGSTENISVVDNILYLNHESGIAIGGYTTATTGQVLNCLVRNNTLYLNDSVKSGSGEIYITKASNCRFRNNIAVANQQSVLFTVENINPQANLSLDYNCWHTLNNDPNNLTINWKSSVYSSLSDYSEATQQDIHSFFSKPEFTDPPSPVSGFDLTSSSPCIDSGEPGTIILENETDFAGRNRISGISIEQGAFEFVPPGILPEPILKEELVISPNPFSDKTRISANEKIEYLSIFSMLGKLVFIEKNPAEIIELPRIPEGVYLIMEETVSGKILSRRLVKFR